MMHEKEYPTESLQKEFGKFSMFLSDNAVGSLALSKKEKNQHIELTLPWKLLT